MADKYGVGQDPYCYRGSDVLINRLNIIDSHILEEAEREITALEAQGIEFSEPPYHLDYLRHIHQQLFGELYDWAGKIRTVDISKPPTRFCTVSRIAPEANALFAKLAQQDFFISLPRAELIQQVAALYADLNMIHPFREGNGRAQRILFEHLIVNCGYQIDWDGITPEEWVNANIAGVVCDYGPMMAVFERCIGDRIEE